MFTPIGCQQNLALPRLWMLYTPNSASFVTWPSALCVCVSRNHSLLMTAVTGFKPIPLQHDLILTKLHMQRFEFQMRSHSEALGGCDFGWGESLLNHTCSHSGFVAH